MSGKGKGRTGGGASKAAAPAAAGGASARPSAEDTLKAECNSALDSVKNNPKKALERAVALVKSEGARSSSLPHRALTFVHVERSKLLKGAAKEKELDEALAAAAAGAEAHPACLHARFAHGVAAALRADTKSDSPQEGSEAVQTALSVLDAVVQQDFISTLVCAPTVLDHELEIYLKKVAAPERWPFLYRLLLNRLKIDMKLLPCLPEILSQAELKTLETKRTFFEKQIERAVTEGTFTALKQQTERLMAQAALRDATEAEKALPKTERAVAARVAPSAAAGRRPERRERGAGAGDAAAADTAAAAAAAIIASVTAPVPKALNALTADTEVVAELVRKCVAEVGLDAAFTRLLCVPVAALRAACNEEEATLAMDAAKRGVRWWMWCKRETAAELLECPSREATRARMWDMLDLPPAQRAALPLWTDASAFSAELDAPGGDWARLFTDDPARQASWSRLCDSGSDSGSDSSDDSIIGVGSTDSDDDPALLRRARRRRSADESKTRALQHVLRRAFGIRQWAVQDRLEDLFPSKQPLHDPRVRAVATAHSREIAQLLLAPLPVHFTQVSGEPLEVRSAVGQLEAYDSEHSDEEEVSVVGSRRGVHCIALSPGDMLAVATVGRHGFLSAARLVESQDVLGMLLPAAAANIPTFLPRRERNARMQTILAAAHSRPGFDPADAVTTEERGALGDTDSQRLAQQLYADNWSNGDLECLDPAKQQELRAAAVSDTLAMLRCLTDNRLLPARCVRELKIYVLRAMPFGVKEGGCLAHDLATLPLADVMSVARYMQRRYNLRAPYTEEWQRAFGAAQPEEAAFELHTDAEGQQLFRPSAALLGGAAAPATEAALVEAIMRLYDSNNMRRWCGETDSKEVQARKEETMKALEDELLTCGHQLKQLADHKMNIHKAVSSCVAADSAAQQGRNATHLRLTIQRTDVHLQDATERVLMRLDDALCRGGLGGYSRLELLRADVRHRLPLLRNSLSRRRQLLRALEQGELHPQAAWRGLASSRKEELDTELVGAAQAMCEYLDDCMEALVAHAHHSVDSLCDLARHDMRGNLLGPVRKLVHERLCALEEEQAARAAQAVADALMQEEEGVKAKDEAAKQKLAAKRDKKKEAERRKREEAAAAAAAKQQAEAAKAAEEAASAAAKEAARAAEREARLRREDDARAAALAERARQVEAEAEARRQAAELAAVARSQAEEARRHEQAAAAAAAALLLPPSPPPPPLPPPTPPYVPPPSAAAGDGWGSEAAPPPAPAPRAAPRAYRPPGSSAPPPGASPPLPAAAAADWSSYEQYDSYEPPAATTASLLPPVGASDLHSLSGALPLPPAASSLSYDWQPQPSGSLLPPPSLLPPSSLLLPPPFAAAAAAAAVPTASGLANATGEYNCFLNSIVQALYRLDCFREHLHASDVRSASPPGRDLARDLAVVQALKDLFEALREGANLLRDPFAPAAAAASRRVVAPTALRLALAALAPGGGEAGVNAMADAAEVLSSMYECFLRVSTAFRAVTELSPIQQQFGLAVEEHVFCDRCRKATHQLHYNTFFHIAHSTALRNAAAQGGAGSTFEQLLAGILGEDCKRCDTDLGGCGTPCPIVHTLQRQPQVFTISLAWESSQAGEEEVAATLKALSPTLTPPLVYRGGAFGGARRTDMQPYECKALVCYYGSHYASFVRTDTPSASSIFPQSPIWTRIDDASVTVVGSWESLCAACARGHLQPTVLFYERVCEQAQPRF